MTESLKLRLIKNAGWLFFAEILSKVFAYGVIVLLSRSFGPDGLGRYSYFTALLGIFPILEFCFTKITGFTALWGGGCRYFNIIGPIFCSNNNYVGSGIGGYQKL